MSMRRSGRLLLAVLCVFLSSALWADDPPPAEEGEPSLDALVAEVQKLMDVEPSGGAASVPFPFGHYAPPLAPVVQQSGTVKEAPRSDPGVPDITISGKMKMGRSTKLFVGRGAYGIGELINGAKLLEIRGDTAVFEYGGAQFTKPIP